MESASTGFAGDQDVELDHRRYPIVGEVVVERGVSAGHGFQAIVKIEDDFVEREFVVEHYARRTQILESFLGAAFAFD